jgi:asparagine synthase (glutamine-hydrolysing)
MNELINYHDGPIATISYYVHSFLSEEISKKGFKVSISGTGADEILQVTMIIICFILEIKDTKYYKENLNAWKKYIKPNIRNPS